MRADKFFADKFDSRTKAAEAIEKGWVLVNGQSIKPKSEIKETDEISFLQAESAFVSNGGYKLERALQTFGLACEDKIFAELGASTGGVCDCLLQNGAKRVYAVDVGESLLHERLQTDSRIVSMDNTNARYLQKSDFDERLDGVVTDVSFISLRLILPVISTLIDETGWAVALIKPQFECENKRIGKSGIVQPAAHAEIVKKVLGYAVENGLYARGIVNAPVRKGKNIEYVVWLTKENKGALSICNAVDIIKNLVKLNSLGELK